MTLRERIEETLNVELLGNRQSVDRSMRWPYGIRYRDRIGALVVTGYTFTDGDEGAVTYIPVEVVERQGQQEAADLLRERFGSLDAAPPRDGETPSAAASPAETLLDDFRTYCLATAANPDDVRAATRASGLQPVVGDDLRELMDSGEAWIARKERFFSLLMLSEDGACRIYFLSVPVADVRALMQETMTLRSPDDGTLDDRAREWFGAIEYQGRIGTLKVIEYADGEGAKGLLDFTPIEVWERRGHSDLARRLRVMFEPEAKAAEVPEKALFGEFRKFCLDLADQPEEQRAAARAAGWPTVPGNAERIAVNRNPSQSWSLRTGAISADLTLFESGSCAMSYDGLSGDGVQVYVDTAVVVGSAHEKDVDGGRQWIAVVDYRGRIGALHHTRYADGDGESGFLHFSPVERFERVGAYGNARRMRRYFRPVEPPAKALVAEFRVLCFEMAGNPDRVASKAYELGWNPIPEEKSAAPRRPGRAWEVKRHPYGAILRLTDDGTCEINFKGVPVADLGPLAEEALTLRLLQTEKRDGKRDWIFAAGHANRIGSLSIVEFACNDGKRGLITFTPAATYDRQRGDKSMTRLLKQELEGVPSGGSGLGKSMSSNGTAPTEKQAALLLSDFERLCVDTTANPDRIRATARRADYPTASHPDLKSLKERSGEAWVIRSDPFRATLSFDDEGACRVQFTGVAPVNLWTLIDRTATLRVVDPGQDEKDRARRGGWRQWAYVVDFRGQVGGLTLIDHENHANRLCTWFRFDQHLVINIL